LQEKDAVRTSRLNSVFSDFIKLARV